MRDLAEKGFNANKPAKNYARLQDEIDSLRTRIRVLEQQLLEVRATS